MVIIITGASRGIGKYLISNINAQDRVGTYNQTEPASTDSSTNYYKVDVEKESDVINFAKKIEESYSGEKIVLVNNAGINIDSITHKYDKNDWDKVININLRGPFLMAKYILPLMRDKNWGRIINISSVVSQMGVSGTVAYSASKSGLFGLTKTIAKENAKKGITVNCFSLGYFSAGMQKRLPQSTSQLIQNQIPNGLFGDPQNILLAIEFLIKADYVNGSVININGGLY